MIGTPGTYSITKYGRPVVRRARVEHAGDVRVVHQRQGLPLGLEPRHHLAGVHPGLDDLQGDLAADRLFLLGQVDHAHAALAEDRQDPVGTDAQRMRPGILPRRNAGPGLRGWFARLARGLEGQLEQADRARGVGGHFLGKTGTAMRTTPRRSHVSLPGRGARRADPSIRPRE